MPERDNAPSNRVMVGDRADKSKKPVRTAFLVRLAGVVVHAHADGMTAREAADLLLDRRIVRISRTRRSDRYGQAPVARITGAATPGDAEPGAPTPPTTAENA